MAHTYSRLLYHVVFATQGRERLIEDALQPALFAQLGSAFKDSGATTLAVGGMPDHVHALAVMRPSHCLSDVVRAAKSCSSGG